MSLKIENLTVYYQTIAGNVRALEDASFSLADGEIMGVRHKTLAVEGVQFHPESILTEYGHELLDNFLKSY